MKKTYHEVWYTLELDPQLDLFDSKNEIGPVWWMSTDSEDAERKWKESIGNRYNTSVFHRIGKRKPHPCQ